MATLEHRGVVDEIRSCVYSPDQTKSDELVEAARQYAEACRAANERLTRCADFLEKGLRTQAIELAEAQPDLLEIVNILSFAELDEWQELAAGYGLDRPQPLKLDVAAAISQAYGLEQQLEKLLKQHRRLALERAPVKERLKVLRRIAATDVTAQYWRDDIAQFERHRVRELIEAGKQAVQNGSLPMLRQWVHDFEAEEWSQPLPSDVDAQYQKIARLAYEQAVLPELAKQILAAMRKLDLNRLHAFRTRWDEIVSMLGAGNNQWGPPQHLMATVNPAFQYLEQQLLNQRYAAFQQDVSDLLSAIRSERPAEEVSFLLAKAESHGFPLSADVQIEHANYLTGARQAKALSLGALVAIIVGAISAVVFLFFMGREIFSR